MILGASAVQIGTGFLRSPEAMIHPVYADRLAQMDAHETTITRATGSISGPTRLHSRNAGRCAEGRRRRSNANVDRPGSEVGAG